MKDDPKIVSIQVGVPREFGGSQAFDSSASPWVSAIWKEPVSHRRWLGETHLEGDQQADLKHHGGTQKAALVYAAAHYPLWRAELRLPNLPYGAFGENFTVSGMSESESCIGDVYAIGSARVQVSQPRSPCWKLSRRWGIKDLATRVEKSGRTGWYLRVLAEGYVESGMKMELLDRPFPQWTVARASNIMHRRDQDLKALASLAACPLLAPGWRNKLAERIAKSA